MKRNNLITGALILSIGGIMAKIFSSIYRIALTRILGGEGIGLYQLIFPFYSFCVVLATSGLPLAISKVIAKYSGSENKIVKNCLIFTSSISLVLTLILLFASGGLAAIQGAKEITICYIILAPTIIIVSATSVLRGYFQGKQYFTPSALSNILEQFFKLALGLILTLILIKQSIIAAIIGAMISIVVSELISALILLLFYKKQQKSVQNSENVPIKSILKDILPITLSNLIMPLASFIDSIIVVNLLSINFNKDVAIFLYGLESGAVSSIITLPTIISFSIASVILPVLTNKNEAEKNKKLNLAIKTVLILTVPCVLAFSLFPDKLLLILYGARLNGVGLNGLKIASQIMLFSGFGIIFLAVNQLYSSCLQAIDERYVAIRNLCVGVIIKFVLEILFLPSAKLNILALALANTICYLTAFCLNNLQIKQHFKLNLNFKFFAKLIFANAVMLGVIVLCLLINNSILTTIFAILLGGIVYLLLLFALKMLDVKSLFKFKTKNK